MNVIKSMAESNLIKRLSQATKIAPEKVEMYRKIGRRDACMKYLPQEAGKDVARADDFLVDFYVKGYREDFMKHPEGKEWYICNIEIPESVISQPKAPPAKHLKKATKLEQEPGPKAYG